MKTIHPTFSLGYYEERAKKKTVVELRYALQDLRQTIILWDRQPGPYLTRLYNERDAYLTELQKR